MSGSFTIEGVEQGLLSGGKTVGPITVTGSVTLGQITDVTLSSGDNTLTVPSGASYVLIVVASSNTAALKVRTNLNSGDTGLPVGTTGPVLFSLASGSTSLIVNAAASGGVIEATFI